MHIQYMARLSSRLFSPAALVTISATLNLWRFGTQTHTHTPATEEDHTKRLRDKRRENTSSAVTKDSARRRKKTTEKKEAYEKRGQEVKRFRHMVGNLEKKRE